MAESPGPMGKLPPQRRGGSPTERIGELERLLKLCERERGLIANELHDGAVQELVAAHMFLQSALESLGQRSPARPLVEQALERVTAALSELRRVMAQTRLPALEGDGLADALQRLKDDPRFRTLTIHMDVRLRNRHFLPTVELAVYRIVQEAIQNVLKHSGTDEAFVRVTQEQDTLRIEIEDHGRGFQPGKVGKEHFGLVSMRQRAQLLGGTLRVLSRPGAGTRIVALIPVRDSLVQTGPG
ncbi:MAG: hypothetical protein KatS3mg110_3149 [Pirellulaceae bacterium]|nr:MAG: hypothetical protein KatS3mg110_3149 [Pirellulaceae bacterium]